MDEQDTRTPLRPLREVWLRPRHVFRTMATMPVGPGDYLLAAAQGTVSWLALCRVQSLGQSSGVGEILAKALLVGPIAGVLGVLLMTGVYSPIGRRAGGTARREQVFHVLAYGGVPLLASLGLWIAVALIVGPGTFVEQPGKDVDGGAQLLLQAQSAVHLALVGWSLLLQIMGFSEVEGLPVRRALGVWFLGQLLVLAGILVLALLAYGPLTAPPGN